MSARFPLFAGRGVGVLSRFEKIRVGGERFPRGSGNGVPGGRGVFGGRTRRGRGQGARFRLRVRQWLPRFEKKRRKPRGKQRKRGGDRLAARGRIRRAFEERRECFAFERGQQGSGDRSGGLPFGGKDAKFYAVSFRRGRSGRLPIRGICGRLRNRRGQERRADSRSVRAGAQRGCGAGIFESGSKAGGRCRDAVRQTASQSAGASGRPRKGVRKDDRRNDGRLSDGYELR